MSKAQLIAKAKADLQHGRAKTMAQVEDIVKVPVQNYFDEGRWRQEMALIFRRLPLVLATTGELPQPGDYKAMEAAGVSLILARTPAGQVKAFVNMCSHRGAQLVTEGSGNARRFTCPYHAWGYSLEGDLIAVYKDQDFGGIDKNCHGLTELPCLERAGIIWGILDSKSTLDIADFLCGYDSLLAHFNLEGWHHEHTQTVEGPNWKVAYDGYLDYYHLPILHRNTFGPDMGSQANYYSWGPHTHVGRPEEHWAQFEGKPAEEWPTDELMNGVWTIFPHVSIASFSGGGRSIMLSQLFPGDTPGTSFTNQIFMMEKAPATEEDKKAAQDQFKFLEFVVQEEDYATGIALQKNLSVGAKDYVLFGRNEGGGQDFHRWVDRILETSDEDLPKLFGTRHCRQLDGDGSSDSVPMLRRAGAD